MPSCNRPSPHRIQKRASSARLGSKRGRGRPSNWSISLQKKLIVLRLCGLKLHEILQIFNLLIDGSFIAQERRAQQLLQKTLNSGYAQFCGSSKDVLRKRVAFLRILGSHDQLQRSRKKPSRRGSLCRSHIGRSASIPSNADTQSIESPSLATSRSRSLYLDNIETTASTLSNADSKSVESPSLASRFPNPSSRKFATELAECVPVAPSEGSQTLTTKSSSVFQSIQEHQALDEPVASDDSMSIVSSRSEKIRNILRRGSYSSSLISEIQSVLNIRFSISTLASSSASSVSRSLILNGESPRTQEVKEGPSPSTVLERHEQKAQRANAALISKCCSNKSGCIHALIKDAILANSQRIHAEEQVIDAVEQCAACQSNNSPKSHWNLTHKALCFKIQADTAIRQMKALLPTYGWEDETTIFFAARAGASIRILLKILAYTDDVNALDEDGQTFLFHVNPDEIPADECCCTDALSSSYSSELGDFFPWLDLGRDYRSNHSGLECFIRYLEFRNFNFDHIDHNGRHFLSYLCSSTQCKGDWLIGLAEKDAKWKERLKYLSAVQDSSGSFLQDFLALQSRNSALIMYISDLMAPSWPSESFKQRNGMSTTYFHEQTRLSAVNWQKLNKAVFTWNYVKQNINRYDHMGHTPIMDFIIWAIDSNLDEAIVPKTRELVEMGANINARARDGSTILHIAAKRSCPELLRYLLEAGSQTECCDEAGYTALDYAAESLSRSRSLSAPTSLTARSFKVAAPLLDYASRGVLDNVALKVMMRMKKRDLKKDATIAFHVMAEHSKFETTMGACVRNASVTDPQTTKIDYSDLPWKIGNPVPFYGTNPSFPMPNMRNPGLSVPSAGSFERNESVGEKAKELGPSTGD